MLQNVREDFIFYELEYPYLKSCKNQKSKIGVISTTNDSNSPNLVNIDSLLPCSVPSILRNSRYRRDPRALEEEEEMWFEGEDEMEEGEAKVPMNDMIKSKFDLDFEQINKVLEKKGNLPAQVF